MHETATDGERGSLLTLVRGIEILEVLSTAQPEGMTHAHLAEVLSFRRSTLYRYMASLEKLGYIESVDGNRYRLGDRAATLSSAAARHRAFRRLALGAVVHASTLVGEPVHATVFSEGQSVTVAAAPSSSQIATLFAVGSRRQAHVSASGMLFLASSPRKFVEQYIRAAAERPPWLEQQDRFVARLDSIRAAGFATDESEYWRGAKCIAAPVFDYTDEIVGAFSITLTASESSPASLRSHETPLRQSARALSMRLGHA